MLLLSLLSEIILKPLFLYIFHGNFTAAEYGLHPEFLVVKETLRSCSPHPSSSCKNINDGFRTCLRCVNYYKQIYVYKKSDILSNSSFHNKLLDVDWPEPSSIISFFVKLSSNCAQLMSSNSYHSQLHDNISLLHA